MKVELAPHMAINVATRREIDTGQDRVMLDGRHVGFAYRSSTSHISLIVTDLDDETKQVIQNAVCEKYGGGPRAMPQPVEIPVEELDADDDDDMEDVYSDE